MARPHGAKNEEVGADQSNTRQSQEKPNWHCVERANGSDLIGADENEPIHRADDKGVESHDELGLFFRLLVPAEDVLVLLEQVLQPSHLSFLSIWRNGLRLGSHAF